MGGKIMTFAVGVKGSESVSKEVTEIINTLCEKLGVAANYLIPELAKYNIARLAFLTAIETLLTIVFIIIMAKIVKWILKDKNSSMEDVGFALFVVSLFPGLVLVFLVVCTVSSATGLIGWIASPTASAVKEITSMIK